MQIEEWNDRLPLRAMSTENEPETDTPVPEEVDDDAHDMPGPGDPDEKSPGP